MCPFYREEEESLFHTLFWCKPALEIWHTYYKWCGLQSVFPGTIKEHYLQRVLIKEKKNVCEKWNCVWVGVVWSLWKARNNTIFRGGFFDNNKIMQKAIFHMWTWLKNLDSSFGYSHDQWYICPGECIRN